MKIKQALTFDDVLLVPKHSGIKNRSEVDLSVDLGKGVKLNIPIVSSNMKTVTDINMCAAMSLLGGLPIMHRFYSHFGQQLGAYNWAIENSKKSGVMNPVIGVSVGTLSNGSEELIHSFAKLNVKAICVDVAHGDSQVCIDTVEFISKNYPHMLLIAGNVATGSGAQNLVDAGADVIKAGVGSGCFAAGTRILMASGIYKNIEDVKENDYVINMNGVPVKVIKSFSTGIKKVAKIRSSIFYEDTYVTPDHQYFIGDFGTTKGEIGSSYVTILEKQSKTVPKKSKFKWKKIEDHVKIALLTPKKIEFNFPKSFEINLFKYFNGPKNIKKLDCTLTPCYELGYVFGTFLGDGNAGCGINKKNNSHSGQVHWYFGKHEQNIANKLKKCCNKLFKNKFYIKEMENIFLCNLNYKPLADFLNLWGKNKNKFLPAQYIIDNKKYLKGLYDGLIDSDGHIEKKHIDKQGIPSKNSRINFTNSSVQIIELFNVICFILNGAFPNNEKRKITTGNLVGANIENFNQCYNSRVNVATKIRVGKNYQISKLLEYSDVNIEVPVYDLTVDCPTHSFIANNSIVHNSICLTRIEAGAGVPQLTALDEIYEQSDNGKKFKIISDGGLRKSGDCVKALCLSHVVMLGGMLAGTDEAPGETIVVDGKEFKTYSGSSTYKTSHVEGVTGLVANKGPVSKVIDNILQGIRSGCSYQGARNLEQLRKNYQFVSISNAGLIESKAHDVIVIK